MELWDRLKSAFCVDPPISKKGRKFLQADPKNGDKLIDSIRNRKR